MKQCNKCKRVLPETEFNFRDKKTGDRGKECKKCRNTERRKNIGQGEYIKKQDREYYHKNIEKKRAYDRKRGKTLKRILWYKKYNKKYYNAHKKEIAVQQKGYYLKNREKKLEWQRNYYWNNTDKRNSYGRKHKHKNREYYSELERRRQIRKQQLFEDFTLEEWKQKVGQTNDICPSCGRPFTKVYPFCPTIDHNPPVSKAPIGHRYTIDDIDVLCGSCNSSKGAS